MTFLQILLAGVLVLGPLIAIHEFGHFWVARRCGVKVLTFSIGFGPALWRRQGRDGTVYQLAAIPLGGFVRMLDEREGEVDPAERHRAFNVQPVRVRMAIVAAGPLINLVFAWLLYVVLALQPGTSLRPVIGKVLPGSPAATAGLQPGDEITAIGGRRVNGWEAANYALIDHLGESGLLIIEVVPAGGSHPLTRQLKLQRYLSDSSSDPFRSLGFLPWTPHFPPVIGTVEPASAADRAGLAPGDRVVTINGGDITAWSEVVEAIVANPSQAMTWTLQRGAQSITLTVTPDTTREITGQRLGRLGVAVQETAYVVPPAYQRTLRPDLAEAVLEAADKTWHLMVLSLTSIGKMLTGLIGMDNLSGPITIAKVAGQSADLGWQAVISFMALLSVSLGVLNLLPIPVLDGGHLLYYAIEAAWRRPLPESFQVMGLRIGVALMGSVMLLAILNDLSRLF